MSSISPDPVPTDPQPSAQSAPADLTQPGHPATTARAAPSRNGTVAWAMGFLAYIPVPFLGLIVAGLTQLFVGLAQRKHGGLAATNGVCAANWGLTQLCWPVLMILALLIGVLTGEPTGTGIRFTTVMNGVMVTVSVLYLVVGVLQAIYAIVGTVRANKGREVRLPVLPLLKAPRG